MTHSVAIIGTRGYPSFYGGFETAVRQLAPYLAGKGWDVTVYGRQSKGILTNTTSTDGIRSVSTPGLESKSLSTLSFGATATTHAAFARKPDVALVMNVANGYFLPLLRARGIPTLVNVDGIEWDRQKWGRLAKSVFHTGAKLTAVHATELVFDAQAIGNRWRTEFSRDGIFIPYGGTNPGELPAPLGLTSGSYALLVARFVPENTVPEFLTAAEKISERHPVILVGSSGYGGSIDEAAAALANKNENVQWLGHVSDDHLLFSLLQHAGAYFHGHSVGGTNPALVQAMACGAPVVARDTVYNREVLGDRGTYISPHPEEIAAKVAEMISSVAMQQDSRRNSLERSRSTYTWDIVCGAYHAELEKLANARTV